MKILHVIFFINIINSGYYIMSEELPTCLKQLFQHHVCMYGIQFGGNIIEIQVLVPYTDILTTMLYIHDLIFTKERIVLINDVLRSKATKSTLIHR